MRLQNFLSNKSIFSKNEINFDKQIIMRIPAYGRNIDNTYDIYHFVSSENPHTTLAQRIKDDDRQVDRWKMIMWKIKLNNKKLKIP